MVKCFRLLAAVVLIFCIVYPVTSVVINPPVRSAPPGGPGASHSGPVYIYVTPTQRPVNYLTIEVSPDEATIFIDGGSSSSPPVGSPLTDSRSHIKRVTYPISPGTHTIRATAPGYQTHTEQVQVNSGDKSYISIALDRDPSYVEMTEFNVKTRPVGASVYVDGRLNGTSPCTVSASVGTHTVALRLEGYREQTYTMDLNSTRSISAQLIREIGAPSEPVPVQTETVIRAAAITSPPIVTTTANAQQSEPADLFQYIIFFFRGVFGGD